MNKAKVVYTSFEKALDATVLIGLILFWTIIWNFNQENTQLIPIHFNMQGKADAFGNPESLYSLGTINSVLLLGLYLLKWFNAPLNFGQEVTESNKEALTKIMRQTISLLALSVLVIFGIILFETLYYTEEETAYSFIFILFAVKVPLIFYLFKSQNIKS